MPDPPETPAKPTAPVAGARSVGRTGARTGARIGTLVGFTAWGTVLGVFAAATGELGDLALPLLVALAASLLLAVAVLAAGEWLLAALGPTHPARFPAFAGLVLASVGALLFLVNETLAPRIEASERLAEALRSTGSVTSTHPSVPIALVLAGLASLGWAAARSRPR